ncbi:MAG: lipoate--protein ligase family protein [Acidiferrobacterales bacterium]
MNAGRPHWRVIDFGPRTAAEYVATNRALLEARQQGCCPNTLSFLSFSEPAALVGFHQSVDQELRRDYCEANGITIQRRVSGGGALYVDSTVVGWELYLDRKTLGSGDMLDIARRICETAARGISALGVDARFRPRNDIEVGGRKIAGTGGIYDGDVFLYHGSLLIDFDIERMLRVLKIPAEKLKDKAIASARERVANLKELLGESPPMERVIAVMTQAFSDAFGVDFEHAEGMNPAEETLFRDALSEVATEAWVEQVSRPACEARTLEGMHRAAGGLLRVALSVDTLKDRIKQAWFTGDFFVNPRRMVADLEAALRDCALADYRATINRFFDGYPVEMLLLRRDDFAAAIAAALQSLADAEPANHAGDAVSS